VVRTSVLVGELPYPAPDWWMAVWLLSG